MLKNRANLHVARTRVINVKKLISTQVISNITGKNKNEIISYPF